MPYNTPWTEEETDLIAESVEAGKSMEEIAELLNSKFGNERTARATHAFYLRTRKQDSDLPRVKAPKAQKTAQSRQVTVKPVPKIFSPGMGQYQINIIDSQGRTVMLVYTDSTLKEITNALKEVL